MNDITLLDIKTVWDTMPRDYKKYEIYQKKAEFSRWDSLKRCCNND